MRTLALSAAIACGLGCVFHVVPCVAAPPVHAMPARSSFAYIALADLPGAAAVSGALEAWTTPVHLEHVSVDGAASNPQPLAAVVRASDLVDPLVQQQAFLTVSAGIAVVVVARPGEPRFEADVFGMQGEGDVVLYLPARDGALHVLTVASSEDRDTRAAMWAQVRDTALRIVADARKPVPSAHAGTHGTGTEPPPDAPRREWHGTQVGTDGRYATQHVTVTRNTTASADQKIITVKADIGAVPFRNGLTKDTVAFQRNGEAPVLFAVDSYTARTFIEWRGGTDPGLRPLSHYPETTAQTDLDLSKNHTSITSFGIGASPGVKAALKDRNVEPTGKLPISISFSDTQIVEEFVSMKIGDYSVAFRQGSSANRHEAIWTFPLAAPIAGNARYFDARDNRYVNANLMTPMMREAGLQTVSTWVVDGSYEGPLVVSSGAAIETRRFLGRNDPPAWTWPGLILNRPYVNHPGPAGVWPDCPAIYDDGAAKPCAKGGRDLQPYSKIVLDLSTPFLTRQPTVLLQSYAGSDLCLSQPYGNLSSVRLMSCDRRESKTTMQWQLDAASRYVNRASGKCLDAHPQTGELTAADCSMALNQQWEWRADRIHSRYKGGMHRIALDRGRLVVAFNEPRPFVPTNINHALLPPWGAYPARPYKGDLVPGFSAGERVPEEYLTYEPVPDTERWATIPLRAGIDSVP